MLKKIIFVKKILGKVLKKFCLDFYITLKEVIFLEKNKRQIPKEKEICASKFYNDKLYAYL